jgi:hypothetical protein
MNVCQSHQGQRAQHQNADPATEITAVNGHKKLKDDHGYFGPGPRFGMRSANARQPGNRGLEHE